MNVARELDIGNNLFLGGIYCHGSEVPVTPVWSVGSSHNLKRKKKGATRDGNPRSEELIS